MKLKPKNCDRALNNNTFYFLVHFQNVVFNIFFKFKFDEFKKTMENVINSLKNHLTQEKSSNRGTQYGKKCLEFKYDDSQSKRMD